MSTPSTVPLSTPKRSKLLIASLALNLLVLGLIGGTLLVRHRHGGPPGFSFGRGMGDPGLHGFLNTLPKDRRVALRTQTEVARQTAKSLRKAAQQARLDVNAAWTAEPLDTIRLEKAFADQITADISARRAGIAALSAAIAMMTPEERVQFQAWRKRHEADAPLPPGAQPPRPENAEPGPAAAPKT